MRAAGKADCGFLDFKNQTRLNWTENLYWLGSKKEEKRSVIEKLIHGWKKSMMRVKIYTDEELPGGGHMEDHIATFNDMLKMK